MSDQSDLQPSDAAGTGASPSQRPGVTRRVMVGALGALAVSHSARAQGQLRDLTIPISSTSFATAPLRAAVELGCFEKHGLKVTTPIVESGSNVTSALISGSAQVVLGGPGELVAAQARGQRIVLLTNVYWGQSGTLILAKEVADKSGLGPKASLADRLKALEGLPLASVSATSALTASFRGAADKVGVKLTFIYMGQPTMVSALEAGSIKGYIASAPIWGPTVARGRGVEWISAPKGELPWENVPSGATGLQAMRAVADANPDLMRRVLDSYRMFSDMLDASPERVRAALGKLYTDVAPEAMDILFNAERGAWKMKDVTVANMQHEVDFVKASGVTIPDIDKINAADMLYVPPK